jgi:fission process protein 1
VGSKDLQDAKLILDSLPEPEKPITLEDLTSNQLIKSVLSKYDTNKDGVLDVEEAKPLLESIELLQDIKFVLKNYDKNSDGKIDKEEMEVMVKDYKELKDTAKVLQRWDADKDGTLDISEQVSLQTDIVSTQTPVRYTGYARTLPVLLRYAAYTSDVGESLRPIIYPKLVTLTYGISWAYVLGDVAWEGYKAHHQYRKEKYEVARIVTERTLFQSFASMIFPAITIHSQVHLFQKIFKRIGRYQRWGPTGAGFAIIPALPYLFDKPVEHAVHYLLGKTWPVKDGSEH